MGPMRWERRFRAPVCFLPEWSPYAPGRAAYASNESGIWQVHAWDVATGSRRLVTDQPVGVIDGTPTLEGGFLRGGPSADGSLLCLEHAEHGDLIHPALRVIDPITGATVGERADEGMLLAARCWSPVAGDPRLAIGHEREGDERPAIWDLATGERTDLAVALDPGSEWPVSGDHARPRRADVARHGSLTAGGAGVRRRRIRGRDGQLPGLARVRPRVARCADRRHRRTGARGCERRPRRPGREGSRRSRASGDRRVFVGRVRHPARARQASGPVELRHRRGPDRRIRGRARGPLATAASLRSRAAGGCHAEGRPRPDAGPKPRQLRRRRPRPGPLRHREERQPLSVPAGDALRRAAPRTRSPARAVRVRDRARVLRRRRGVRQVGTILDFLARHVPGARATATAA